MNPSELRSIPGPQLTIILEKHKRYLETGRSEGERADLSYACLDTVDFSGKVLRDAVLNSASLRRANLSKCDIARAEITDADLTGAMLSNADLSGADLSGSVLDEARLIGTNCQGTRFIRCKLRRAYLDHASLENAELVDGDLEGASLVRSILNSANLTGAILKDTNLQDAKLDGAKGLLAGQLTGANLAGAGLPSAIQGFEGLSTVDETSKSANKLFITLLLACLYSFLTVATTTDSGLVANSVKSSLPIVTTEIPIVGFYSAAPFLLLCLFIYFHLYLQRLFAGLAALPAIFPDGKTLDQRIHPFPINSVIRMHFCRLLESRPPMFRIEVWASSLLTWGIVPLTILVMWFRYLSRHEWHVTLLQIFVLVASSWFSLMSYREMKRSLRREGRDKSSWKYEGGIVFGLGLVLVFLSHYGAMTGVNPLFLKGGCTDPVKRAEILSLKATAPRVWVPRMFRFLGLSPFANFERADVSMKPPDWPRGGDDLRFVKGVNLERRNLRYANATQAFLVNANLNEADFEGANLLGADLRGFNVGGLASRPPNFRWADLMRADLRGVAGGNFDNACLAAADLRQVSIIGSFQGANLANADLRGATFFATQFQGAQFVGAKVDGAKFFQANLSGVIGLSIEQISVMRIDDKTVLPDYLLPRVR